MSSNYINSKGQEVDVTTMAYSHLKSALAKAEREGNEANVAVLAPEVAKREADQGEGASGDGQS